METKIIERFGLAIEMRPDGLFRRVKPNRSDWKIQAEGMTLDETVEAWVALWLKEKKEKEER